MQVNVISEYGLDEAFLRRMVGFYDMPTDEVSAKIREAGFLFLQAHPFRDFMQKTDFDYTYAEGPGVHNWAFWDEWVKKAIKWMIEGR